MITGNGEYVDWVGRSTSPLELLGTLTLNAFHSSLTSSYSETALAAATKAIKRIRIFILFRMFRAGTATHFIVHLNNSCGM